MFLETILKEFMLPLKLICREAASQRTANFKITVECSGEAVDVGKLFPGTRTRLKSRE